LVVIKVEIIVSE